MDSLYIDDVLLVVDKPDGLLDAPPGDWGMIDLPMLCSSIPRTTTASLIRR